METTFAEGVFKWHDFYFLAGTAAGSLIGLLFVAVSLHLELISSPGQGQARVLAEQTFASFILVLLISLAFLVPAQTPLGISLPLLVMGLAGCLLAARTALRLRQAASTSLSSGSGLHVWRRFALPSFSYVALTAAALLTFRGRVQSLLWVLVVVVLLLVSAATSAWDLG